MLADAPQTQPHHSSASWPGMGSATEQQLESKGGLAKEDCVYTSCFCEENVWLLIQKLHKLGLPLEALFAVFISNSSKQVPLWRQRSGRIDGLAVWDYHVVLVQCSSQCSGTLVWDLDSTLPFPCAFPRWSAETLGAFQLPPHFTRLFRVVRADTFLRHFASDRSHMWGSGGSWQQPPPPYPCITAPDGGRHTLPHYIDMPPLEEACDAAEAAALRHLRAARGEEGSGGGVLDAAARERYGVVLTQRALLECFSAG